jgi:ABC-type sugar transport system permease subunit
VLISAFVSTIGFFEPVFMLTGGGPADATRTLPIFLYENFFQFRNGGYASAAGVLFLLLCLGFAVIAARMLQYTYYE